MEKIMQLVLELEELTVRNKNAKEDIIGLTIQKCNEKLDKVTKALAPWAKLLQSLDDNKILIQPDGIVGHRMMIMPDARIYISAHRSPYIPIVVRNCCFDDKLKHYYFNYRYATDGNFVANIDIEEEIKSIREKIIKALTNRKEVLEKEYNAIVSKAQAFDIDTDNLNDSLLNQLKQLNTVYKCSNTGNKKLAVADIISEIIDTIEEN